MDIAFGKILINYVHALDPDTASMHGIADGGKCSAYLRVLHADIIALDYAYRHGSSNKLWCVGQFPEMLLPLQSDTTGVERIAISIVALIRRS